jgi:rubrerythrin
MNEIKGALKVLRHAIHNEIAGQRFYNDAAYHCIDPWAKEVFATLSRDEEIHTRLLVSQHEALSTEGHWLNLGAALASDADLDAAVMALPVDDGLVSDELFPSEQAASQTIDRMSDDLAALAFAVHLEQQAIDLYVQAAAQTNDLAAREAFTFLVEEEGRHLQELKERWENLAGRAFAGG